MMSPYEIKKEICEIGRRIYNDGFVAANDGNISVKVSDNEYYCTPTGVSKGFMTPLLFFPPSSHAYESDHAAEAEGSFLWRCAAASIVRPVWAQ